MKDKLEKGQIVTWVYDRHTRLSKPSTHQVRVVRTSMRGPNHHVTVEPVDSSVDLRQTKFQGRQLPHGWYYNEKTNYQPHYELVTDEDILERQRQDRRETLRKKLDRLGWTPERSAEADVHVTALLEILKDGEDVGAES